ncbi:MAG: ABC transporter permease [Sediminibacterium sp.]|nr:ABC transporter permease [Sediminibacterium sp.]
MSSTNTNTDWDLIVKPQGAFFRLNLKELWAYRDLIILMVKRDLTALYKQTILGPVWMFLQPLFTTLLYTFLSKQAQFKTDNLPPLLFYLIGQTYWLYFAECFTKTSNTFITNASVFGKVYFPRMVMPVSVIVSNLIRLGIQMLMMLCVYGYYLVTTNDLHPQYGLLVLQPFLIVLLGLFALGLGVLFSAVTTKYRDFSFLLGFGLQLFMFVSGIVFPASTFSEKTRFVLMMNPVMSVTEAIKFGLTGQGYFSPLHLGVAVVAVVLVLFFSIMVFNRTERNFMDTV